jgi:hypothetical protein
MLSLSDRTKWAILIALPAIAATAALHGVSAAPRAGSRKAPVAALAPAAAPLELAHSWRPRRSRCRRCETDAIVRQLVTKLSSHPTALAWLATDGLIRTSRSQR